MFLVPVMHLLYSCSTPTLCFRRTALHAPLHHLSLSSNSAFPSFTLTARLHPSLLFSARGRPTQGELCGKVGPRGGENREIGYRFCSSAAPSAQPDLSQRQLDEQPDIGSYRRAESATLQQEGRNLNGRFSLSVEVSGNIGGLGRENERMQLFVEQQGGKRERGESLAAGTDNAWLKEAK